MPSCAKCGEVLARSHRRYWEKPFYALVFRCRTCDTRIKLKHSHLQYIGGSAACPRCGSEALDRRESPDKIDQVVRSTWGLLMRALGGHLYHCVFCRIQFYDLRERASSRPLES